MDSGADHIVRRFIEEIDRPLGTKPRHNGYDLLMPEGRPIFGYVRHNQRDRSVTVYAMPDSKLPFSNVDPQGRFQAQENNRKSRYTFPDTNEEARDYALCTLRLTYDSR